MLFHGTCEDALSLCQAMCCCQWDVRVSREEIESAKYSYESICSIKKTPCDTCQPECFNRFYRLIKKENGNCLYLDDKNKCTIYDIRPLVCRNFTCKGGWKLESVFPAPKEQQNAELPVDNSVFTGRLDGSFIFMRNPLRTLQTSFYSIPDREIVLVTRRMDKCGTFTTKSYFDIPTVTDSLLFEILRMFDGEKQLDALYSEASQRMGTAFTQQQWRIIVLLFINERLLIYKK